MAFRPTVIQNPATSEPPDAQLARAEQDASAHERQWAVEAERMEAAAMELAGRLQQAKSAAAQAQRTLGPDAQELMARLSQSALPLLDLSEPRAQAQAARQQALQARQAATAAAREALHAYSAELSRVTAELEATEAALVTAEKRSREEQARRTREQAQAARPPPPPAHSPRPPPPAVPRAAPPPAPASHAKPMGRRDQPRVKMQAAIDLGSDSNFFTGFSTNISEGGLFVATVAHFEVGTSVDLHFSLPGGKRLDVKGIVRWSREVNDKTPDIFPGVGVQFADLSPEAAQAIHRFVSEREPMFYPD